MAEKTEVISIRLGGSDLAAIDARTEEAYGSGRSSVAQRAIARYLAVVQRDVPDLSREEWNLIADANNGSVGPIAEISGAWHPSFLIHNVADAIRLNRSDEHHGCNGDILVGKMQQWGHGQLVACLDVVERFWADAKPEANQYASPLDIVEADRPQKGGDSKMPKKLKIKTVEDMLTAALFLALTAPTKRDATRAAKVAAEIANGNGMSEIAVARCKRRALAGFGALAGFDRASNA